MPPAPSMRGGRTRFVAKYNSITHRHINNRYQLLLWASIINTPYSNYTIIIMMNNLLVEIGLALQRQICKRAGNVWCLQFLSVLPQPRPLPPPPNEGHSAAAPTPSPRCPPGFNPPPSSPPALISIAICKDPRLINSSGVLGSLEEVGAVR